LEAKRIDIEDHTRDGFDITVAFDGMSVVEQYQKPLALPMSTPELAALLGANSGGAK